jgi:hypothetical protein
VLRDTVEKLRHRLQGIAEAAEALDDLAGELADVGAGVDHHGRGGQARRVKVVPMDGQQARAPALPAQAGIEEPSGQGPGADYPGAEYPGAEYSGFD